MAFFEFNNRLEAILSKAYIYVLGVMVRNARPIAASQATNAIVNNRHHELKCNMNPKSRSLRYSETAYARNESVGNNRGVVGQTPP